MGAALWWRGGALALGAALWSAISAVVAVGEGLGLVISLSTQHVLLLWKILGGLRDGGVK